MTPAELQRAAELKAAWDAGAIRGPELDEARELFGRLLAFAQPASPRDIREAEYRAFVAYSPFRSAVKAHEGAFAAAVAWREGLQR